MGGKAPLKILYTKQAARSSVDITNAELSRTRPARSKPYSISRPSQHKKKTTPVKVPQEPKVDEGKTPTVQEKVNDLGVDDKIGKN